MTKAKGKDCPKSKAGRPTKFKEEYIKQAAKLCSLGAMDRDLADFFEVNEDTINEWKKVYPNFSESLKQAKVDHDTREVESSLLKRAKGFTRTVEKPTKFGTELCHEEIAPDTTACIFWLKNRDPNRWRDKQDIEHSGGVTIIVED